MDHLSGPAETHSRDLGRVRVGGDSGASGLIIVRFRPDPDRGSCDTHSAVSHLFGLPPRCHVRTPADADPHPLLRYPREPRETIILKVPLR